MNSFSGEYDINVYIHLRSSKDIAQTINRMCCDGKRIFVGKYNTSKGVSPMSIMEQTSYAIRGGRGIIITATGDFLEEVLEKYANKAGRLFQG